MNRVLVSLCLLGHKVRYNNSTKLDGHPILDRWAREGRIVPVCPEVSVGFPTPRLPAEIAGLGGGTAVNAGDARVIESTGRDVTELYRAAALATLNLAVREHCRYAVLADGSPSCGSTFIYDGSFQSVIKSGQGATTALLQCHGIRVFTEQTIEELDELLDKDCSDNLLAELRASTKGRHN